MCVRIKASPYKLFTVAAAFFIHDVHLSAQDDPTYQTSSDVKSQLRVFEQIDEIERRKREAREREVLIRAAKVRLYWSYFTLCAAKRKIQMILCETF